ncbi:unnamed protein product [Discosporangium mesarthrocarpum]
MCLCAPDVCCLPLYQDTPPQKREALLQQKLQLCSVVFDMSDPLEDRRGKEIKRATLLEIVDYIGHPQGKKVGR